MDDKGNMSPLYEANHPIPLEETWITDMEGQSVRTPVRVILRLLPQPKFVVEFDDFPGFALHMSKEKCRISFANGGKVDMYVLRSRMADKVEGAFSPVLQPCTILDKGRPLQSVQFSILNFPEFIGKENQYVEVNGKKHLCGIARLEAAPWLITITATSNLRENLHTLRKDSGYAITHTGFIERSDGGTFSVEDVQRLFSGLRLFLSFVRGASCGLTLIEGKDQNGEQSWVKWGSSYTMPWRYVNSCADDIRTRGDILSEVFPGFWRLFERQTGVLNQPISLALYWYLCSNASNTLEPGIILTHAALERLAHEVAGKKVKSDDTGVWIGKALKAANIDPKIPGSCQALEALRRQENVTDGAEMLTRIRNDLVHAEMKMNVSMEAYTEARNLGQWYVELLLLKLFNYSGSYTNRFTQQSEVVP